MRTIETRLTDFKQLVWCLVWFLPEWFHTTLDRLTGWVLVLHPQASGRDEWLGWECNAESSMSYCEG